MLSTEKTDFGGAVVDGAKNQVRAGARALSLSLSLGGLRIAVLSQRFWRQRSSHSPDVPRMQIQLPQRAR